MTPSVAIVALALSAHPPLALVRDAERLDLPASATNARIEARPLSKEWVLHVPAAQVAALVKRLRNASRLCPEVVAGTGQVILRCVSARLRADMTHDSGGPAVILFRLSVLPWRPDEEGPPLVAFDTVALHLGACPGETSDVRGECALAAGKLDEARTHFEESVRAGPSPLAELRLGDLALRDDDPDAASAHWRHARGAAPWSRLANARQCELDARCLDSDTLESVYDTTPVDRALRADLLLRRARLTLFQGEILETARRLTAESGPGGACLSALPWCRRLILMALQLPQPAGTEALALYLELPGRRDGPLALELLRAAALQAERAGAPEYAANLLAAATGDIPAAELAAHLRRVTELYLAALDRAHADEIVRFAGSRLPVSTLRSPVWEALKRAVRAAPSPPTTPATPPAEDADLASAHAALAAARIALPTADKKGTSP